MRPERLATLKRVLAFRQPDLTVLMDNVHKSHNFSAVLRSCDAVGVLEAHAVWPNPRLRPKQALSGGAGKWLNVNTYPDVRQAVDVLRARGMQLIAAHLAEQAVDYREVDYTRPTAIVLGAELEGVSSDVLDAADRQVVIPMQGMAESLNVSVAAAILLFEAQRQRLQEGMYARDRLDPSQHARTLFEWAHPQVAAYCRRQGLDYPQMDDDGGIDPTFRINAGASTARQKS